MLPDSVRYTAASLPNKIKIKKQKYLFVKLPYIGKYSARIKRDLMKILKDYRPYMKLRLISYPSIKIGHLFKKSLGQIPFRYTSNVVYKISCACGHSYIVYITIHAQRLVYV